MVDVRKVFPNAFEDDCSPDVGYEDLYKQFGTVLIQIDIGTYQGDTFIILEKDGRYGYLTFGWGSCSLCDSLLGCSNFYDLQNLSDHLESSIRWFNTKDELKEWAETHDWECDWAWRYNSNNVTRFLDAIKTI